MRITAIYPKYYPRKGPRFLSHWHTHWVEPLKKCADVDEINFRPKDARGNCYAVDISKQFEQLLETKPPDCVFFFYSYRPERIIRLDLLKEMKVVAFGGDDIFPGYFEQRYKSIGFADAFVVFEPEVKEKYNYDNIVLSNWAVNLDHFNFTVNESPDLDLSFVGSVNEYRGKMLRGIEEVQTFSKLPYAEMLSIFNRSKVSLSFQDGKKCAHLKLRNLEIAGAGGCQVSDNCSVLESSFGTSIVQPMGHFKELLRDPQQRNELAKLAYNKVRDQYSSTKTIMRLLDAI